MKRLNLRNQAEVHEDACNFCVLVNSETVLSNLLMVRLYMKVPDETWEPFNTSFEPKGFI